MSNKELPETGD